MIGFKLTASTLKQLIQASVREQISKTKSESARNFRDLPEKDQNIILDLTMQFNALEDALERVNKNILKTKRKIRDNQVEDKTGNSKELEQNLTKDTKEKTKLEKSYNALEIKFNKAVGK